MRRHLSFEDRLQDEAEELPERELRRRALSHLRECCGRCATAAERFEAVLRDGVRRTRSARGRAWAAVALGFASADAVFEADLPEAKRELGILRRLSARRRLQRVERARTRYRSPLLIELLIAEARQRLKHAPRQSLNWLDVAAAAVRRAVSDLGDLDHTPPLRDLSARIRGQRANVFRVLGQLRTADEVFAEFHRDTAFGSLAVPTRAELLSLEASLRLDQRHFVEADRLLTRAADLHRQEGDRHGLGRVLLQQGIALSIADQPARAVELLGRAAEALPADEHPELHLAAQHGIAISLCQLGEFAAARELVDEIDGLYRRFEDPWTQLRWQWVEGKIATGLGDDQTALGDLEGVRSGYLERELPYDGAMVALDLAELHLRRGETREVERLAEEMVAVFERIEVHRETGRALSLLGRAAAAETLTLELIRQLRTYLLRVRSEPGLAFDGD
jgi:tetratricopeptide (TPR) repeat protein